MVLALLKVFFFPCFLLTWKEKCFGDVEDDRKLTFKPDEINSFDEFKEQPVVKEQDLSTYL